jgi:DNA polymerase III delta prime subunit
VFILATTLPEKVPKPIRDRLTRYELKLVDRETSLRHLVTICKAEGFAFELPGLRLLTEPGPAAVSSGRRRRARGAAGRSTCPSRGRFSSGRRARP